MADFPAPPPLTELYAIYCEAYSAVRSEAPLPAKEIDLDLARSTAKMIGAGAGAAKSAPERFASFVAMLANYLDPDWRNREPYGPPR